ncbi:MAG: alanine racemase [Bacteroidota bacterium]
MTDPSLQSFARVEVNLDAIRRNARILSVMASPARLLGVVKSDAYGHGAVRVARALVDEGVDQLAVATVAEGAELRNAGIEASILVFAAPLPDSLPAYARYDLAVTISSRDVAAAVTETARTHGPLRAHVKVDTGMHRLGLRPDEVDAVLRDLDAAPGVTVEALWTHLATADGDLAFARRQMEVFRSLVSSLGTLCPPVTHIANGPMLLRLPEDASQPDTLVRVGGVLYGMASSREMHPAVEAAGLAPVMRLVTRVVHLQTVAEGESISYGRTWVAPGPRRIATVAIGYADGLPRGLSNAGRVGIKGALYPIAGRVCMDMLMVDLGPPNESARSVRLGDEAVLFGTGGPHILDQAEAAGTMPYELTCALASRVARS